MAIFSGDTRCERKLYNLHIGVKDLKIVSHKILVKSDGGTFILRINVENGIKLGFLLK
jgi:hypothetical protein